MSTQGMDYGTEPTSGWVVFAGVVTFLAAIANLLYGITLLAKDDWVVITPDVLIQFDLTTVGVIYLIFSALGFFVGMGIFHGDLWARCWASSAPRSTSWRRWRSCRSTRRGPGW